MSDPDQKFDPPGAGERWRIIRQANAFVLQIRDGASSSGWRNQGNYPDLEAAMEVAEWLFGTPEVVWPIPLTLQ